MEYHIGKYLEDNEVASPFYNFQPETDDTITTVYSESVPVPDYAQGFNSDLMGIKFLTRGVDQQATRKLSWDIHRAISQLGSIEITVSGESVWIVSVDIVNVPTYLERDDKGRVTFVSHYSVHAQTTGNAFRKATITETYEEEIEEEP